MVAQYKGDPKACTACGTFKPRAEFYAVGKDKKYSSAQCVQCVRQAWVSKRREWNAAHPEAAKRSARRCKIRAAYGIELTEYQELLDRQGGGCAICGATKGTSAKYPNLTVDHDHASGAIRGILCQNCNAGLGNFKDDPERMAKAAAYIRANRCISHV